MGIATGPHFELTPATLARWLEERGPDTWWLVDGDPSLTGRLAFPSPTAPAAALLRTIDRPLLIRDRQERPEAKGQPIGWEQLDEQVEKLGEAVHHIRPDEPAPEWAANRFFWLVWKDRPAEADEWMLVEDRETAEAFKDDREPTLTRG